MKEVNEMIEKVKKKVKSKAEEKKVLDLAAKLKLFATNQDMKQLY